MNLHLMQGTGATSDKRPASRNASSKKIISDQNRRAIIKLPLSFRYFILKEFLWQQNIKANLIFLIRKEHTLDINLTLNVKVTNPSKILLICKFISAEGFQGTVQFYTEFLKFQFEIDFIPGVI
jgi:hypothetical protein